MHPAITKLESKNRKPAVAQIQSGDTVRVHQLIREGNKQRVQVFEGVVVRTRRLGTVSATITVRRIASGVGVEKTYLIHSPNVAKVEVVRRAKVRRNFLSYLRERRGKSARLKEIAFDRAVANVTEVKADVSEDPLAANEVTDADLTEIATDGATEEAAAETSTEEVVKEENKAVAADDETNPVDSSQGEENQLAEAEAEKGVEKADQA